MTTDSFVLYFILWPVIISGLWLFSYNLYKFIKEEWKE